MDAILGRFMAFGLTSEKRGAENHDKNHPMHSLHMWQFVRAQFPRDWDK
ncbi:MAG: hypothetical protein H6878_06340 [Rhodobiaceae bacterium]|nr:hypothetical protein [Rhodobiaceae bacterium]MCC0040697.1 hypothetical protein [Rhodobiaceae bacterium]